MHPMYRERMLVYRDDVPIEMVLIAASSADLLQVIPFRARANPKGQKLLLRQLQRLLSPLPWSDAYRDGTELACAEALSNACRHGKRGTRIRGRFLILGSGPSTAFLLVLENRLRDRENPALPSKEDVVLPHPASTHGWGFALMRMRASAFRVMVQPGNYLLLALLFDPQNHPPSPG